MPKSAKLYGIKSLRCYTIPEAAEVTGVSERTIRNWIKRGLKVLDNERPTLIRGDALITFSRAERAARKTGVGRDEFYCLKCRGARRPADGFVQVESDETRCKLIAICDVCETIMYKSVARDQAPKLSKFFELSIQDGTANAEILAVE